MIYGGQIATFGKMNNRITGLSQAISGLCCYDHDSTVRYILACYFINQLSIYGCVMQSRGITILLLSCAILLTSSITASMAESPGVEVPEITGFADSHGAYVVTGVVKNNEPHHVVPRITINVLDGDSLVTESFLHLPIAPLGELPFRVALDVADDTPVLLETELSYTVIQKDPINVHVVYDETLLVHDDGSLTGRVINNGDDVAYDVSIYAVAQGEDYRLLDVGRSLERIDRLEPGEVFEFSMRPDPLVSDDVGYYSCFAITDSFIIPVYTERNNDRFYFRYEAGTWYSYPEFNEPGTELRLWTQNSFPMETYANFEFPLFDETEQFTVYVNDVPKEIIQSIDEEGNWHVAFIVEPFENGHVLITGFAEGWDLGDSILVPDWMRANALWWSEQEEGGDEIFFRGIQFMINEDIIQVDQEVTGNLVIPAWIKGIALLWADGQIDDATFVYSIEYLIKLGIIQV